MELKITYPVDLDGTVADIDSGLADHLPEWKSSIFNRTESEYTGVLEELARKVMTSEGFFRTLPLLPYAKENIEDLMKRGTVIFVSSPIKNAPYCISEKISWIEEHFGFPLARSAVFCKDKTMIVGDYLIDDRPQTGRNKPLWKQLFPSQSYNVKQEPQLQHKWIEYFVEKLPIVVKISPDVSLPSRKFPIYPSDKFSPYRRDVC